MSRVITLVVIWLLCINLFAFYALNRFNLSPDTAYIWINSNEFYQNKNLDLVNLRVHWDSFWYLKITREGYQYEVGKMNSIAFFPLYPGLIWAVSKLPQVSPALAGWIISTLALAVGLIFFYKLVKEFHPEIDPLEPIIYLLIFPTAFFLTTVYTESLFLALSIVFFYHLFKKKFFISAVFLSLACLTRLSGVFLFAPFIYEYLKTYGFSRFFNINLASFLVGLSGIVSFMLYQYLRWSEPLAFFKSQMEWGRKFTFNPEHFQLITPASYAHLATDLLFFTVALISGSVLLKRIRLSYGLYVLMTALAAISTGTLIGMGRFILILFPIFILVASVKSREFKFGWVLLSILLLASYTTMFVSNYWAG